MDRLVVMRTFVTVAKSSSFSRAARELGISGSLVSRHVADLEKQVGVRLVNRTARSVSMTEAGERYGEFAERILDEIENEDIALGQMRDTAEGSLAVISPKWIGSLEVGDALAAFALAHPKISLRFELGGMSDRTYDFLDRGFDVAFHTRDLRDSNLLLRRITDLPFVLCASKAYVERYGVPTELADLAERECIVHPNDPVWRLGAGDSAVHYKVQGPALHSNSYLVIIKWVLAGCGIGVIPRLPVQDHLDSGDLVEILPDLQPPSRSLYAVHAPGGQTTEKVRVLLDFMSDWFKTHKPKPVAF